MAPGNRSSSERRRRGGIGLIGEIGAFSAICIVGGVVAGLLIDRALHIGPVFLLLGVLGGFGAAMFKIIRLGMEDFDE